MTRVLVTGAGGQLGRALAARPWPEGWEVSPVPRGPRPGGLDLSDLEDLRGGLDAHEPDLILNAAAYTAVDKAEDEPDLAARVNAAAPGLMAEWCKERGAGLVHVSTDYVFDGSGARPWRPADPTAPLSVYGRTKAEGEARIRETGARASVIRTSWVYDAEGRNFLNTMMRLAEERDMLTVVGDQIGAPTYAPDLAEAVAMAGLALTTDKQTDGFFHFANAGETGWAGFAEAIMDERRARGLRAADVTAIGTEDWPTPAARPRNSRLDLSGWTETFDHEPRGWRDALAEAMRVRAGPRSKEGAEI